MWLCPRGGWGKAGPAEICIHSSSLWFYSPTFPRGVPAMPATLLGGCPAAKLSLSPQTGHPRTHTQLLHVPGPSRQGFLLSLESPNPINCRAGFTLYVIFQASLGQSTPTHCCSQQRGRKQSGYGLLRMEVWHTLIRGASLLLGQVCEQQVDAVPMAHYSALLSK